MLIDVRKVEKGIVEKPSISQLKTKFKFQPGKYYKHTTGHMIHCLGFLDTTIYGRALISEESCSGNIILVGFDSNFNTANYVEITEEEWLKRSDVTSCSKKMATKAVIDPEVPAATDGESSTVEASVEDISEGLYDIIDDYLSITIKRGHISEVYGNKYLTTSLIVILDKLYGQLFGSCNIILIMMSQVLRS